jgi:hypothetical protein
MSIPTKLVAAKHWYFAPRVELAEDSVGRQMHREAIGGGGGGCMVAISSQAEASIHSQKPNFLLSPLAVVGNGVDCNHLHGSARQHVSGKQAAFENDEEGFESMPDRRLLTGGIQQNETIM